MSKPSEKKPRNRLAALPPAWADAASLIAGLLLPLAFSPFDLFPFAVLSPTLLFVLWWGASPGRAAWRGLLFGLGMFGLGVSWVFVSMHHFGNMPAPLAGLAVLIFITGLSLYPALIGWIQARLIPGDANLRRVFVLPSLWVLFEWIRGWFLTGFPWLDLGYSLVGGPLAGYAPWLGVYGVSFFCALCAGLIAWGVRAPRTLLKWVFPLLVVIWAGGWLAGKVEWTQPIGNPLQATLLQGNVPIASKWNPEISKSIISHYIGMSSVVPKSDLIVWPESAVPSYLDQIESTVLDTLRHISRVANIDFLIGVVERDKDKLRYYNSVVSISSQPGVYRKRHLVPFGEYPPLDPLFAWLMRNLQIPMSDFSPGPPDQPLLYAAGRKIAVTICYEDAFGAEVIRSLPEATLLVNVSEDAWFGDSFAPHQRVQMARMRARETGRPLLRAANTGPSMAIDHRGKILAQAPQFQIYTLAASVQPMTGATPFVRFGNLPMVLFTIALIVAGIWPFPKRNPSR